MFSGCVLEDPPNLTPEVLAAVYLTLIYSHCLANFGCQFQAGRQELPHSAEEPKPYGNKLGKPRQTLRPH
jgi:hypothetical protein